MDRTCADNKHASRLIHRHRLSVLTPEQEEVVGVKQLEAKEGENDFNGERATIHEVPVEQLNSVVRDFAAQDLDSVL